MYSAVDALKDAVGGNLKIAEKDEATRRYELCNACPHFRTMTKTCAQCGCFMPAKTKLLQSSCPIGVWVALPDPS